MIHPFSILDSRTKDWKDREKWWLTTYNIQSELGRDGSNSKTRFWENNGNVSVFSPTLSETMYNWFCPPGGSILDPFAGGSVRGIVAEESGFKYTGIDISKEQIEANRNQSTKPNWIVGDSRTTLVDLKNDHFDFVFTCPPYHDLEIYSDNPMDLSTMQYDEFLDSLNDIIWQSSNKLKDNRFFGIVVSEIRDLTKTGHYKIGKYKRFVSKVIDMCEKNGLSFYNDMVLINSTHQAARTLKTYFERNRKVSSVHQNVLVFVKGNPDLATENIINNGVNVCKINGTSYTSLREAAIDIEPNILVASEVDRRCKSTKSKYKNWQIIGKETKPNIRYEVSGIPFESFVQIAEVLGGDFTEGKAATYVNSNAAIYRHWSRATVPWDISYKQMDDLQSNDIHITLPVISVDGIEHYSLQDAADFNGISSERIRQKLKDSKYPQFKYLY